MSVNITKEENYICGFLFPSETNSITYKTEHGFSTNIEDAKVFESEELADKCAEEYGGKYESFVMPTLVTVEHIDEVIRDKS